MCASANKVASGFSISGLLDVQAQTRDRYPVVEIDTEAIQDHPNNSIYSMNEEEIKRLALSIEQEGLTDLPLVRKLQNGQWQMLSGHRRKAAFLLLSASNSSFKKIPCRVVDCLTDAQALTLLHAANLFTRQLSATERAAASRALGVEVEQMRLGNPELVGQRTEDIKAAIITQQTGRKVSGKTVRRQELLAEKINELAPQWKELAECDYLSMRSVEALANLDQDRQVEIYDKQNGCQMSKRELSSLILEEIDRDAVEPDKNLVKAERALAAYASKHKQTKNEREQALIASLRLLLLKVEQDE